MICNQLEKRENIEDAAYIYWSKEENVYLESLQEMEHCLHTPDNPETILIEKDFTKSLSKECMLMAKTIMNLPEEMFLINGKLKKTQLRKLLKQRTGWSTTKIDKVKASLARQLLDFDNQQFQLSQNY